MRSVLKKDTGETKRRNSLIIGLILIILMVFSTAGYAFFSSDRSGQRGSIEYQGIEFKQTEYGSWIFEIQGNSFETRYNPYEINNISVIINKNINDFYNKALYFGIDSNLDINQLASQEISINLQNIILRASFACLSEECEENLPIKDCKEENIIIFKEREEELTRIREEEECIIVYYTSGEEIMASDALLIELIGI